MQVPKGRDQVSGGVSVPCRHATPVADALWKPISCEISALVKSPVIMSQTGIMSNRYRVSSVTKLNLDQYYVMTNSYTKFQVNISNDNREKSGKLKYD